MSHSSVNSANKFQYPEKKLHPDLPNLDIKLGMPVIAAYLGLTILEKPV
jgi:hypothetical protein